MKKLRKLLTLLTLTTFLMGCSSTNPGDVDPGTGGSGGSGDTGGSGDGGGTGEGGGTGPIVDPVINVESISLNQDEVELTVGDTFQIVVTFVPSTATNKNVTYRSSYSSYASVSNTGLVTANAKGKSVITVTSEDGGHVAYLDVTVKEKGQDTPPVIDDTVHVTGISLNKQNVQLKINDTFQIVPTISPSNATNKTVSYVSSDTNVAIVSDAGLVTAKAKGSSVINVTTQDSNKVAYLEVKVVEENQTVLPAIDYVKIFALKKEYTTVYAWTTNPTTKLVGDWPGTSLTSYDDTWYTYDFEGYTSLNFILSNAGQGQTSDLSVNHAGYYWYFNKTLTSTQPELDANGNPITPTPDVAQGNYEIVNEAKTANDLPAVKNYNKGQVLYPYRGNRDDFRDESIYFMITTRFYDGDSSNNKQCWDGRVSSDPEWRGDFKGLIEKMDYIKALGFTAIWITPVVKNASGFDYHGYHAINFKEVDPRYESNDVAFKDVIREAHSRDMKIILDVVFNHTGNYGEENLFPMFNYDPKNNCSYKGVIRNKESGILGDDYDNANNQYNRRIEAMKGSSDVFNIYHHERSMGYEQYVEQTGQLADDCVDLNTENPTVANYLVEAFGEFIRLGVDAFRIDTMKHISRLTFNNYIWPGLYKIAEKCGNNHFYMFGEVCTRVRGVWNHDIRSDSCPFYTWKEDKSYTWGTREENEASTLENWNDNTSPSGAPTSSNVYLNSGLTYHTPDYSKSSGVSVIDFPMHWNFQYASDAFNVAVNNDQYYNDASFNVTYVDSHDYGPDCIEKVRYNQGTDAWKENMSLLFTFRGVPCIYYGSEIEFQAGKTIDEGPNLALANSGRAYYGANLEGNVTASDFGVYTASGTVQNTLNSTLSKHLTTLNKIRLKVPALRRGQYTTSNVNGSMAFTRRYTSGNIDSLACVAISNSASFNSLPNGKYVDLVSGQVINVTNGNLTANVSGQGNVAIYVLENSSTGTLTKI